MANPDMFKTITEKNNTAANTAWYLGHIWQADPQSYVLDDDAVSGVYIGKVKGGTVLGQVTATKKVVPCGHVLTTDANTSATVLVAYTGAFRVGDTVTLEEDDGTPIDASAVIIAIVADTSIELDASNTWVVGDVIRKLDGSSTAMAISWLDANTWSGQSDESGVPIHGPTSAIRGIHSGRAKSSLVIGMNTVTQAELTTLGFRFE